MRRQRALCQPPNKRMQRTRVMDKFVLRLGHRRVADAQRYAAFQASLPVLTQP